MTKARTPFAGLPLPRDFYDRRVEAVARDLLGKLLIRATAAGLTAGRIVEAEAYLAADDPACHACNGRTRRNASMFGPPGHAYVYSIHSRWCLNTVTEPAGTPSAVLIRAIEPLAGINLMTRRRLTIQRRRARAKSHAADSSAAAPPPRLGRAHLPLRDLARGPARLCEALVIDRRLDGWDLTRGRLLWIAAPAAEQSHDAASVICTPRIGVTSAHDLPLRFCLADCPFVSGTRRTR